jgi:N-dimethylarginine dimethylaminohydrolase
MTAPLRRVLVRTPGADLSRWREYGWRSEPDAARVAEEHETLCAALEQADAEVVVGEWPADGKVDALYVFDPALVTDTGRDPARARKGVAAGRGGRDPR